MQSNLQHFHQTKKKVIHPSKSKTSENANSPSHNGIKKQFTTCQPDSYGEKTNVSFLYKKGSPK